MTFTTAYWEHLVEGLRKTGLLSGIISQREAVRKIIFTLPSGEKIEIPENSRLEIYFEQSSDLYAVGIEHTPGSFGMTHGPVPNLGAMLEVTPSDLQAKILCFPQDGGEERITHRASLPAGINTILEWEAVVIDTDELLHTEA